MQDARSRDAYMQLALQRSLSHASLRREQSYGSRSGSNSGAGTSQRRRSNNNNNSNDELLGVQQYPNRFHQSFGADGHPLQDFVERTTQMMLYPPGSSARVQPNSKAYTHAFMDGSNSMSGRGYNIGHLAIPPVKSLFDEFYRLYAESLDAGAVVSVSEAARIAVVEGEELKFRSDAARLFMDMDLKTITHMTRDDILNIARICIRAARKCWQPGTPATVFRMCVLLRKEVETTLAGEDGNPRRAWKNGAHFVMPNLLVTPSQALTVRQVALKLLREEMPLGEGNPSWDALYDEKVDALRMVGSAKASRCKACRGQRTRAPYCSTCTGRGKIIDRDAAYQLDTVLNADGTANEAAHAHLEYNNHLKVMVTHIAVVADDEGRLPEPTPGFAPPPGFQNIHAPASNGGNGGNHGGDEEGSGQQKKNQTILSTNSELFEYLEMMVSKMHPEYANIRLQEVQVHKQRGTGHMYQYTMVPYNANAYPCLNLVNLEPHNNRGIYFTVHRKDGQFLQRCWCKCKKGVGQGRVAGMCSKTASVGQFHITLPPQRMLQMFNFSPKQLQEVLQRISQQSGVGGAGAKSVACDRWLQDETSCLNQLSMKVFGVPHRSALAPHQRPLMHALRGYLMNRTYRSTSIIARENLRRKERAPLERAQREIETLVQQMQQTSAGGHPTEALTRLAALSTRMVDLNAQQQSQGASEEEILRKLYTRRGVGEECKGMWVTPILRGGTCALTFPCGSELGARKTLKLSTLPEDMRASARRVHRSCL